MSVSKNRRIKARRKANRITAKNKKNVDELREKNITKETERRKTLINLDAAFRQPKKKNKRLVDMFKALFKRKVK